jgi:DNA-binding NtrC family response regulator
MKRVSRTAPNADRVLLVEDELRLREMLLRALTEMGFRPTGAASGEAALRMLDQNTFGVMILDLNLPGMDGLQVLTSAHSRWPNMQVIILTGFGDLDAAKQAIRMDVVDFLTKPCALGDLEIALDRARTRYAERVEPMTPEPEPDPEPLEFSPRESSAAMSLEEVERKHILAALEKNGGNRNATAAELGISLRKLYYRLAQYQKQGQLTQ